MHTKTTLIVSSLLLCLFASVHAYPLRGTHELAERGISSESDFQERSPIDASEFENLVSRDVSDPFDELVARAPVNKVAPPKGTKGAAMKTHVATQRAAKAAQRGQTGITPGSRKEAKLQQRKENRGKPKPPPKAAAVRKSKAERPSPVTKKAPPADKKGKAMDKFVKTQRDAKAAQRGQTGIVPGSKKAIKLAQKKENRDLAKKQKFREGVNAGKYKLGLSGKPEPLNAPKNRAEREARKTDKQNKKLEGARRYNALTPSEQAHRATRQANDRANHAVQKAQRLTNQAAARKAAKDDRKGQMAQARKDYKASISTGTFPNRKAHFATPQGQVFKGKDVRQALFNGHAAGQPGKGVGYDRKSGQQAPPEQKHPKTFENRPNAGGGRPIAGLKGTGREFGIMQNHVTGYDGRTPNPTAARLITQANKKGVHEFKGVVAHPRGTDDHVQVSASGGRKPSRAESKRLKAAAGMFGS